MRRYGNSIVFISHFLIDVIIRNGYEPLIPRLFHVSDRFKGEEGISFGKNEIINGESKSTLSLTHRTRSTRNS